MPTLKRAFDVTASCAGLAVLAPAIVPLAALMAYDTRSNPFFKQERVGKDGEMFTIYKIKTMRDAFDETGKPLPDDQRTSPIGKFVRTSRIDEVCQLLNVVAGDMSLVGPRPMTPREYISAHAVRQSVPPGVTGPAQTGGNNDLTLPQVLDRDLEYINYTRKHNALENFVYELKIIADTPLAIIRQRNTPHYRK